MGVLKGLQPKAVFQYFEEIAAIPHGSGNTAAIAAYLMEFAADRGLEASRDAANNVVIKKPASKGYEASPTLILQGHHDMVCEKDEGKDFDFATQGIEIVIDGDDLRANGTTLGGDNGIAVAMMLAILDDKSLAHPPLELLITADEEIGMVGAFAFDCSRLSGSKLINLDSEYEGVLMCSCAGGVNNRASVPVTFEDAKGTALSIEIKGLASGHSGVEIDKGRANANVLMARLLDLLKVPYQIVTLSGGARETAIAPNAACEILVQDAAAAEQDVRAISEVFQKEYAGIEPGLAVEVKAFGEKNTEALTAADSKRAVRVLLALPDSVQAMSQDMKGLVQTSTNLGLVKLTEEALTFTSTTRSAMRTQKEWITAKVRAIVELAGGTLATDGNYPGWAYNPHSVVKDTVLKCYKELTGKDATVEAVHAGIECGLFADAIPDLDCVSIGPDMGDVHTPREHLSISSTERTYKLLTAVLAASK